MVQTYGIASENDVDASGHGDVDESRALLGGAGSSGSSRTDATGVEKPDGKATLLSCASNLSNTIMGTGMLTFPMAMASAGLLPGVITCALSGGVAAFGLYLLSLCATQTKYRHSSFHAVSQLTFPKAAVFFDAAIAIKCFGVSISYLIIIKGLMPNVVESLYHVLTSPDTNPPPWMLNGGNWISIFMFVLVPLSFLRKLHSLRHTSYIALFAVAYLLAIVIRCYCWPIKNMPAPGEIRIIHFTPSFVSTFPVQVFAYTCAQNLFPIYNELKSNTQKRMNIVIGGSIGTATLTYEIISVIGYLTFGSNVGANIIAMYPSTSLFIAFGQLAIVILVMFSYPLQVHPCRNCLDKVFHPSHVRKDVKKPSTQGDGDDEDDEDDGEEDDHVHAEMSTFKHSVLTAAIIACGFTIAYFVDDLRLVLSFVGSTGSTTISFILPGLFYWKLSRDDPAARTKNILSMCLALYGIFIFIFCLGFNIYQIVYPDTPPVAH